MTPRPPRPAPTPLLAATLFALVASAQPATTPSRPAPAQPTPAQPGSSTATIVKPAPAPSTPVGRFTSADQLLTALETADQKISTLASTIRIRKVFSELEGGDKQANYGTLAFLSAAPTPTPAGQPQPLPRRMFQIDFAEVEFDNQRQSDKRSFIFDGRWYVERDPQLKQIMKREIVPAGQQIDPLAIGSGPFWIPIGQKKDQILERFDAQLLPPAEGFPAEAGAIPSWVSETVQLRLVPKRAVEEARNFREVRIWYRAADLLPRMARTVDSSDATTEVFLTDMAVNKPLPKGTFDTTTPTGWVEDIKLYRAPAPAPAGDPDPGEDK